MGTFAKRNDLPLDYRKFLVCDMGVCLYIYIYIYIYTFFLKCRIARYLVFYLLSSGNNLS